MLTLDHLVILVSDLDQAVADYQALGFAVTPGGTHADGLTHNALVVFADGTYLELIAFVDSRDTRDNVWDWRQFVGTGGGLIDYCAASPDLAKETERLRRDGLAVGTPSDGGRHRPDGKQLHWRSARFDQGHRVLPFLIEDVTPRALRVPPNQTMHTNGVTGIQELTIAVDDFDAAVRQWHALVTHAGLMESGNNDLDAQTMVLELGVHRIGLVAPSSPASELYTALPGPFSVTFTTTTPTHHLSSPTSFVPPNAPAAYGLRMRIITE